MGRLATTVVLGILFFLQIAACSRPGMDGAPPNVILITIDTLRADHCSAYGYARETTPFLDSLAEAGIRFDATYAPMAVTGPSHATLFTSISPTAIGMERNGVPLRDDVPVLAEILADHGYETAAFVSSYVVSHRFGFDRGFAHFDDDFSESEGSFRKQHWEGLEVEGVFDRRAGETNDRVLAWLNGRDHRKPLFLWVHYFDPHRPFVPPAPFAESFLDGSQPGPRELELALYDGEILYTDTELRRVISALDRDLGGPENNLIWVTADHGEGLMDHGWPSHGPLVYEEDVRVPQIVRWPGRVKPGQTVLEQTALLDVLPTLLDLLEIPFAESELAGESLAPAILDGQAANPNYAVYFQRRFYESDQLARRAYSTGEERVRMQIRGNKFGVRVGRWKLIEANDEETRELYDLNLDPQERRNVVDDEVDIADDLLHAIAEWRAGQLSVAPPEVEVSSEELKHLRALGYLP